MRSLSCFCRARWCVACGVLIVCSLLGLVAYLSHARVHVVWGYPTVEVRMVFRDLSGNPIEGVELCVVDENGQLSWGYPVSDYLPGQFLQSNGRGVLVFHHKSQGPEYSYQMSYLSYLLGYRPPVPRFVCRFSLSGRIILEAEFSRLIREGRKIGISPGTWDACAYIECLFPSCGNAPPSKWLDVLAELKNSHSNCAQVRYHYIAGAMETCLNCRRRNISSLEDIQYQVVEHIIIIPPVDDKAD